MTTKPIALFVDDELSVLEGIRLAHGRRFDVRVATSGKEGLEILAKESGVAIIVSDIAMPFMDGAEFLSLARQIAPGAVRMLLTGTSDLEAAARAVNDGRIFHFLTKPCSPKALESALDLALDLHEDLIAKDSTVASRHCPIPESRESRALDDLKELTAREQEVLQLIAKGLRISEVAPLLHITAHTVCTHVKSIYRKRQLASRAEAALEAQRLGLV